MQACASVQCLAYIAILDQPPVTTFAFVHRNCVMSQNVTQDIAVLAILRQNERSFLSTITIEVHCKVPVRVNRKDLSGTWLYQDPH